MSRVSWGLKQDVRCGTGGGKLICCSTWCCCCCCLWISEKFVCGRASIGFAPTAAIFCGPRGETDLKSFGVREKRKISYFMELWFLQERLNWTIFYYTRLHTLEDIDKVQNTEYMMVECSALESMKLDSLCLNSLQSCCLVAQPVGCGCLVCETEVQRPDAVSHVRHSLRLLSGYHHEWALCWLVCWVEPAVGERREEKFTWDIQFAPQSYAN